MAVIKTWNTDCHACHSSLFLFFFVYFCFVSNTFPYFIIILLFINHNLFCMSLLITKMGWSWKVRTHKSVHNTYFKEYINVLKLLKGKSLNSIYNNTLITMKNLIYFSCKLIQVNPKLHTKIMWQRCWPF